MESQRNRQMQAILIRESEGPHSCAPAFVVLNPRPTTIGRRGRICMDTPSGHEISKIHAVIRHVEMHPYHRWFIDDHGSVNGTFVNGMKIWTLELFPGDEVVFAGGPNFLHGHTLQSTSTAVCRYRFFLPDPPVVFRNQEDLNAPHPQTDLHQLCLICYDTICLPQKLVCGHSFCLSCIQEWSKACRRHRRNSSCPVCRAAFPAMSLPRSAIEIAHHSLIVHYIAPFLRELEIPSCRNIRAAHIFKPWSDTHKKFFWATFQKVGKKATHRWIFLALTKATARNVIIATEGEIVEAMKNFGIPEISENRDENARRLLLFLFQELLRDDALVRAMRTR